MTRQLRTHKVKKNTFSVFSLCHITLRGQIPRQLALGQQPLERELKKLKALEFYSSALTGLTTDYQQMQLAHVLYLIVAKTKMIFIF